MTRCFFTQISSQAFLNFFEKYHSKFLICSCQFDSLFSHYRRARILPIKQIIPSMMILGRKSDQSTLTCIVSLHGYEVIIVSISHNAPPHFTDSSARYSNEFGPTQSLNNGIVGLPLSDFIIDKNKTYDGN